MLYVGTGATAGWHVETQLSPEGGGNLRVRSGNEPWQTVMTVPAETGKALTFALLNACSDSVFATVATLGTLDGASGAHPILHRADNVDLSDLTPWDQWNSDDGTAAPLPGIWAPQITQEDESEAAA
jgi:hypothetical protein